jgi:hypothetical protein
MGFLISNISAYCGGGGGVSSVGIVTRLRAGPSAVELPVGLRTVSSLNRLDLLLHAFFWVILRRMNLICRRFGTLCLFHLHRRICMKDEGCALGSAQLPIECAPELFSWV